MSGKLIIICAPSGSGKTSILNAILPMFDQLSFSVSACSRKKRIGEEHGRDYYFIDVDEFREKISQGAFIEWEEVYPGNYYGTLMSEVERIWAEKKHVIFDVDVIGGLNIKKKFHHSSLAIFIMPPSIDELRKRLVGRGTESNESIETRINRARFELKFAVKFDVSIINDNLDDAVKQTRDAISAFLEI